MHDEPGSSKITDLDTACEEIFQHHKRHIIVTRTPDCYPNIDSAVEGRAMNMLESRKVIFKPNPSDSSVTQINPIVTGAPSYNDALGIIQEKGQRAPMKASTIIADRVPIDILEPLKKRKSNAVWIVLAIIILLFLLFNFVPFYKWILVASIGALV